MGGIILGLSLTLIFLTLYYLLHKFLYGLLPLLAFIFDLGLAYNFIALKDLLIHSQRIKSAIEKNNISLARQNAAQLVGRDIEKMDYKACARAGIESVSENTVDGVISPLFYLLLFGLPGMLLFKIASTMDSMVGYRNERYLQFGWFGARLDDVMNFLPARISYILTGIISFVLPKYSGLKAFNIGWCQHKLIPGPNSGWSEAAFAGALKIKLIGPIYNNGALVTDLWLGHKLDREGALPEDMHRAHMLAVVLTVSFVVFVGALLLLV